MFRAVVLADTAELTVASFRRSPRTSKASSRRSRRRRLAPRHPAYTGPALLGAEGECRRRSRCAPKTVSAHSNPAVTATGDVRPLEEIEADMIRLALGRYRGHMTEVAKRLKIGRSTLYRKCRNTGSASPALTRRPGDATHRCRGGASVYNCANTFCPTLVAHRPARGQSIPEQPTAGRLLLTHSRNGENRCGSRGLWRRA